MGEIEDSDLIGRRLTNVARVLAAHGAPERPRDLRHHTAVLTQKKFDHWTVGGGTIRICWRMSTGSVVITRNGF
jgi:hypothetical protein